MQKLQFIFTSWKDNSSSIVLFNVCIKKKKIIVYWSDRYSFGTFSIYIEKLQKYYGPFIIILFISWLHLDSG